MRNIQEFFYGMSSEASLYFLIFVIMGFLLGVLAGYLLRNAAYNALQRNLKEKDADLVQKKVEVDQLKQNLAVMENNRKEIDLELQKAREDRTRMASRLAPMQQELDQAQRELEESKTAMQSYLSTIEEMQDEMLVLKTRNQRLEEGGEPDLAFQPEKPGADEGNMAKAFEILSAQLRELQQSNRQISEELQALKSGKMEQAEPLQSETSFQPQPIFEIEHFERQGDPGEDVSEEEPLELPSEQIPEERVALLQTEEDPAQDDLTRIEGIGPFLQQKLFEVNITTFQQIASMTLQDVQVLTQKIGYIPGRIEKDDWVGQARSLLTTAES